MFAKLKTWEELELEFNNGEPTKFLYNFTPPYSKYIHDGFEEGVMLKVEDAGDYFLYDDGNIALYLPKEVFSVIHDPIYILEQIVKQARSFDVTYKTSGGDKVYDVCSFCDAHLETSLYAKLTDIDELPHKKDCVYVLARDYLKLKEELEGGGK